MDNNKGEVVTGEGGGEGWGGRGVMGGKADNCISTTINFIKNNKKSN